MTPPIIEERKAAERRPRGLAALGHGEAVEDRHLRDALEPGMPINDDLKVSPVGTTAAVPISIPRADTGSMP